MDQVMELANSIFDGCDGSQCESQQRMDVGAYPEEPLLRTGLKPDYDRPSENAD